MAKIIRLEDNIFVAPQIVEDDFEEIAARGFRAVVNNRPDGEAEDQLPSGQAESAAKRNGLQYRYEPVTNADVADDGPVASFASSMMELPGPILFYCRSGTRCTTLWAQASAERLGVDTVVQMAADAGYDLEAMRPILEERAGNANA